MKKAVVTDRLFGATPIEMDLRDYFAGQIVCGLLSNSQLEKVIIKQGQDWITANAWLWADAMIDRREKDNR
jgi:hypothetical protein